ncbi:hypothetical protein [Stackebrandtia nassauensis]|nr:hypothetical protein [Stackebrandtia nassauensis]
MTYPPQGGYPDDPINNGPDPQSPFGYPDQPASPPSSAAPYTPPPPNSGWPDSPPTQYGPMSQPGPAQYGPPPGGMGAAPQQGGFAPQPPPSSGNATIGWVIGGIAAVLVIVAGIAGVIFFANAGNSEDSGTDGGSSSASDSSAGPSQTPTDVVNDYYDAVRAHDVDGAYKTLCSSMQGSESDFFGSYDEDEFWKTVDASTYTVGEETIKDDSNANVKVKQEVQGETYDFSADLQIESGEWKICYWNTPT